MLFFFFYSIKKKAEFESEIQSLMKLRSKNEDFLKQLYREAYQLGAVFHLTKFKTEELEEKIAEVRRKFKVCISVFYLVVKKKRGVINQFYWFVDDSLILI